MCRYLCQELIDEIFKKLPVKSLVRFRSLSKYWYSRIGSPDFIRMHDLKEEKVIQHVGLLPGFEDIYILHSEDQLLLDPGPGYMGITGVNFDMGITGVDFPGPVASKFIGSCNGIICLLHSFNEKNSICLWNVSIRRKLTLPNHPFLAQHKPLVGFGFDPITNDYKIVVGTSSSSLDCTRSRAFIYTLKTNSWSEIAYSPHSTSSSWPCFFNGTLHWVVDDSPSEYIMTFNLSSNVFDKIWLPRQLGKTPPKQVRVINGSLALVYLTTHRHTSIWVMKEYNNVKSWYLHFTRIMNRFYQVEVFQPIKNNGDLLFSTNNSSGCQVYNPQTGLLSKVLEFRYFLCGVEMEKYVESLELLDKGTPCGETVVPLKENECLKRKTRSPTYDYDDDYYEFFDDSYDYLM